MVLPRLSVIARNFTTSAARRSGHHDLGGVVGENLPFNTDSVLRFSLVTAVYVMSAGAIPFLIVRHQLLKHN